MTLLNAAWIILSTYAAIGLALLLIGPLGNALRYEIGDLKRRAELSMLIDGAPPPLLRWKLLAFGALVGLVMWIAWPLMIAGAIVKIKESEFIASQPQHECLSHMGGAGTLRCRTCDHSEQAISFLHGSHEDPSSISGYQCQQCARLHTVESKPQSGAVPACECGGRLSRDEVLMCPQCRSSNVIYQMEILT